MISDIRIEMKFVLLLLLLLLLFYVGDAKVRCIEREREALLRFKNGLIDESGILSSWRPSVDCCNWYGVVCSNTTAHVIHLELGTGDFVGGFRGKVSSSLLELHHLTLLDLSYNDFGGHPIPEFIGSMKQLQHLYLQQSSFSGMVPPQLGNLTNLRTLDLSSNSLSSNNLNWLSTLSLLSHLDLSWNDFGGHPIPESIGSMKQLKHLHLRNSSFSGMVPPQLGNLTNLRTLDLSSNRLGGEIPNSLGNLTQLQVLALYDNKLRGKLDEFIGNLSSRRILEILDLARNKLAGSVPDLTSFSALAEVYLGSNKLRGFMPASVGQLSRLRVLEVSGNYLEGAVSESHFLKLHHLKTLDLSSSSLKLEFGREWHPPFQSTHIFLGGCHVGPSFPKWIQTQTNLKDLDLSAAGIVGEVPSWFWNFSASLRYLSLSHNQITGTIPDLSSTSITNLDISSNQLSGPIPLFHNHSGSIQLSQNMFMGSISSLCDIPRNQLEFLGLSNNQLSGEIPDCWQKMPNLQCLDLANNKFMGMIPRSISSLNNLFMLQLHGNNLSGELPSSLRFCQELFLIDVGENQLTGEIPAWIGEIYTIRFLNLGSNRLHGSIPPGICNLTRIQILDIGINNLFGEMPDCFNNFTSLARTETFQEVTLIGFRILFLYNPQLPNFLVNDYTVQSLLRWKGQEIEYENLDLIKFVDFSSNNFTGNIPKSFSNMKGVRSLNLSGNQLTGNIIQDIGQMEMLESLDLSNNQLSGEIPTSLAQIHSLSVLDLSNNNLSGKIPSGTQLQSFNTSSYAGNSGLCGSPLTLCPEDAPRPPTTTHGGKEEESPRLSFMEECGISMAFGFIFGFWGVVGSFVLKKSWRYAFFNFLDAAGDWLYVTTTIFLSKWTWS